MSTPVHTTDPRLRALERECKRVETRVRVQRGLSSMTRWGAYSLAFVALLVGLNRLRWLDLPYEATWIVAGYGVALLAFIVGWAKPVSTLEAAQRLDLAFGLFDRLASAWSFSRLTERSAHHEAAISDAERFVAQVTPKAAAPWALPPRALPFASSALMLTMVSLLVLPVAPIDAQTLAPLSPPTERVRDIARLSEADKARLVDERERLEAESQRTKDPRVSAWISELNTLLRALHEGRVTPTEAHRSIAKLERAKEALNKSLGEDAEAMSAHMKKAAQKTSMRPKRALSETLDALRAEHWRQAAEAMERLAERLDKGQMSARARKRLGKDMAALAKRLETQRQRERDRLKKKRDRLKRKEAKARDRFSKRDRDRLKRHERRLERLERQAAQAGEMRRQLERLQRGLSKGAQALLKRLKEQSPQMGSDALRKAAEMLRRMSASEQGRRQMRAADGRLIDLKELLRRAQRSQGSKGSKGSKGGALERFLVRAKGGQGGARQPGGKGNEGEAKILALGKGSGGAVDLVMPGQGTRGGQGQGPEGGAPGAEGDSAGHGHDPQLTGAETRQDVTTFDAHVSGREGEGDSKSRVVFSAAKKGFASQAWGKVHQDYRAVVEQALDEQSIPAGKRRYVRRYFELIRPR